MAGGDGIGVKVGAGVDVADGAELVTAAAGVDVVDLFAGADDRQGGV